MRYEDAIAGYGNLDRFRKLMLRAGKGNTMNMVFLGGSITQDCITTVHEKCYAHLVYDWWCLQYPGSRFNYINAGVGGTTSQYGAARAERDVAAYDPDFIVVEFSVNDKADRFFQETYEGLLRKLLCLPSEPAILIVNTVQYENGVNAQKYHNELAEYYGIPVCSMKNILYKAVIKGELDAGRFTVDMLHPNDYGHMMMADIIDYMLSEIQKKTAEEKIDKYVFPEKPFTRNGFEDSVCLQNDNYRPAGKGFTIDRHKRRMIKEIFVGGWTSSKEGAYLKFEAECSSIAVQYRKTIKQPSPIAEAVIDGDEEHPVILDGNFDERWGDCLFISNVAVHMPYGHHTVRIKLTETHDNDVTPFYLVSVIVSKNPDER